MTDTTWTTWLADNLDRYIAINARRDAGESVASTEKEFVARYDRRRLDADREATFTASPYLMANPRTWEEARRDELARAYQTLEQTVKALEGDDRTVWAKLNVLDAMADIRGEIDRLTDEIGDEWDWKGEGAAS